MKYFYFCIILFLSTSLFAQIQDSVPVFYLGTITVTGQPLNEATFISQSPSAIHQNQISDALEFTPGLDATNSGDRNDAAIYVRGFDVRQVPVFYDGIPVYVPYDGSIDINRLTLFGLSGIQVFKGISAGVFGPNTMGGAINLVSSRPVKPFQAHVQLGTFSGGGQKQWINLAHQSDLFYVAMTLSNLSADQSPLSASFPSTGRESGGFRDLSDFQNRSLHFKTAFTPSDGDEYALVLNIERSNKSVPTSTNPADRARFWQFPNWDKNSVYLITRTLISNQWYLTTRWYYDTFYNVLKSYDDKTLSSQTFRSSFTSTYDDYTFGSSGDLQIQLASAHQLTLNWAYKQDIHQEEQAPDPQFTYSDHNFSGGLEYQFRYSTPFSIQSGVALHRRLSLDNQNFPHNDNLALHGFIGGHYQLTENDKLSASIGQYSRFPTMKDRYSFRTGQAIPNPELKPEYSLNTDISWQHIQSQFQTHLSVFFSELNDVIQQVDDVQPGIYQFQNTGQAQFSGFEGQIRYFLTENIRLKTLYTFTSRKNISNPDTKFIDVPSHLYAFIINVDDIITGLDVLVNGQYQSERNSNSQGDTVRPFFILNGQLSYSLFSDVSLHIGVQNILDRYYDYRLGYPAPGRLIHIEAGYEF